MEKSYSEQNSKTLSSPSDRPNEMEQLEMSIISISSPFPSITRVVGKIKTNQPECWAVANPAIRILFQQEIGVAPISRVYTVRSFDVMNHQIEIDLVKHIGLSPAMRWLDNVKVGDRVSIIGPRPHFTPSFSAHKHVVMFADDTGVPAIFSILNHWQDGISADLYIESFEQDIIHQFPDHASIHIHFHHKNSSQQQKGWLLNQALQLDNFKNISVWAACERNEARALREFFLKDQNMQKNDVQISGYWKDGVSSSELDTVRAQHYLEHTKQGKSLAEYDDLDMPS